MFKGNCKSKLIESFLLGRNKIAVLTANHWKVVGWRVRDTIGESPLDKLYMHIRFSCLKQIYLSSKGLHHC